MLSRSIFMLVLLVPTLTFGEVVKTPIQYRQGDTVLKGVLVYDNAKQGPLPGVIVFPEWWGLTEYPQHRAEQLAQLGYAAFAADMYGNGVQTDDPKEAAAWSGKVHSDLSMLRARAQAAFDVLANDPHVDRTRIAAIGYCFGGQVALELARSGANLVGVVSFHGGLGTPNPDDAKNIKGKILVCTGAEDKFIPPEQIAVFEDEMRNAGVDWQVIVYGGAHHAFTNPAADSHHLPNIAYNANADRRSWAAMRSFLDEVFTNPAAKPG